MREPIIGAMALLATGPAMAAGFYASEVGSPGSLGTAGVANPTNNWGADTVWTNPAGMTGVDRARMVSGMTVLIPKMEFSPSVSTKGGDDGGNAGAIAPVPSTFYLRPIGDRLRFGVSVTAPLGGGIDYGGNFAGRYSVTKATLAGVGLSGALAYRVNDKLSIGGGVTAIYTYFDEDIAVNQGPLPDGKVKLDQLDDVGFQGYLGVQWKPTDKLMLGAVYRTESDADLEGDIKVQGLAIPFNPSTNVGIEWTNPQWLDLGLRYSVSDDLHLFASGGWQDWSEFSQNTLSIETRAGVPGVQAIDRRWRDTWYLGAAMIKRIDAEHGVALGVKYDSSPVTDENRTLDLPMDEIWSLSASFVRDSGKTWDYSIGTTLYLIGDAKIDQTSQGVRVAGDFDTNVILFVGATLRRQF